MMNKKPFKTATKKPRPVVENSTVYISNLNYKRDKQGIKNLFSRYGKIKNINLVIDFETKKSKGMAFVEMETLQEAKLAIAGLNFQEIDGRTLKASYAIPQKKLVMPDFDEEKVPAKKPLKNFRPRH